MKIAIGSVELGEGAEPTACLVRLEDGAFLPLEDAVALLELMMTDQESYVAVMTLARNVLSQHGESLDA